MTLESLWRRRRKGPPPPVPMIPGKLFQALVFHGDGEALTCEAYFEPEWTAKLYVTWYAISNLFVPLVVLMFCYGRIWGEDA